MKQLNNKIIIGIDHGYGNIKTANHCFPNGVESTNINPLLTKDILIFEDRSYQICQGHKSFLADKEGDEDYYILTLAAIAMELNDLNLTQADIIIAAGLPLKWAATQKDAFTAYLSRNKEVQFSFRNIDYHIRISDVLVYPQGYAAVVPFKSRLSDLNMIADIGNGTLSSFFIGDGKVLRDGMYMDLFGTQQCIERIRDTFFAKQRGRSTTTLLRLFFAPENRISRITICRSSDPSQKSMSTIFSIYSEHMVMTKTRCCSTSSAVAAVW